MKDYIYKNELISKKQLRELLAWSFTNYDSMQACLLADELKYLGFKYATYGAISISIEDLKVPFVKNILLKKANEEIFEAEKIYLKGKMTEVERFQKIIDTWDLTSESLKTQIINYFKNYDPLNSVYIMAFSGARGNLSQVRQLVGMRGLMSDPSGQIMNLPIKKNFREGLTVTDYLISGYGARKGIIDTALKTANSGYLTRRLIDVAQDIIIREKDCQTKHDFSIFLFSKNKNNNNEVVTKNFLGRVLNKPIYDFYTNLLVAKKDTQITYDLLNKLKQNYIKTCYVRSPLTCNLYRSICQKCYGWDLATENLIDIGDAIGILAGQSIGEPGTQLTMRTFHTGGVFTSGSREQIISPSTGILKFPSSIKIVSIRTNRGEQVSMTKNFGSLVLIPDNKNQKLIKINILKNTIIFPKDNQYILKNSVIGELIDVNKQIKTEIKQIVSNTAGEIFIPPLIKQSNLIKNKNNQIIWILENQYYKSPINSFLNFYYDYKLNNNSYIFRTKLVNNFNQIIEFNNYKKSTDQRILRLVSNKYNIKNSKLYRLTRFINRHSALLAFQDNNYLIHILNSRIKNYIKITREKRLGTLLTNNFKTLTGGKIYYDYRNILLFKNYEKNISYFKKCKQNLNYRYNNIINYRTICWIESGLYYTNYQEIKIFAKEGDYIPKGFELLTGLFTHKAGFVSKLYKKKSNVIIIIKFGNIFKKESYNFNKFIKNINRKLYYPGENLLFNYKIKELSILEPVNLKNDIQLLIQPIKIYEFDRSKKALPILNSISNQKNFFDLKFKSIYRYNSNQLIYGIKTLNLISKFLLINTDINLNDKINIQLSNNKLKNHTQFIVSTTIYLKDYLLAKIKYQKLKSCILVQLNQFLTNYLVLGYIETITLSALEIIKFKVKLQTTKQICLISNQNCLKIKKSKISKKQINNFIISKQELNQTGKIISENNNYFILQKGRPYFFPNCQIDNSFENTNLYYKILPKSIINLNLVENRSLSLQYCNQHKLKINNKNLNNLKSGTLISIKSEFSKLILKNKGKIYRSLIPRFLKKSNIKQQEFKLQINSMLYPFTISKFQKKQIYKNLLIQTADDILKKNKLRNKSKLEKQFIFLKFAHQPFTKSTKTISLHSITEDYFEQQVNNIFSKNNQFIKNGEIIGSLNLEKEITGDIVQGLPRIEEILEARKKNMINKRIPKSQKKGLLIQKSRLDINLEFKKLGTTIQDNDKVNPHKLLKVYFNYYGLKRLFQCDIKNICKLSRLVNNYEGTYKSFKKVQTFILNSVQAVYKSQGVQINDKHLEIIIKQMTTKVLITEEGNTPLLKCEVIDLYHIQYINDIILTEMKQVAYYVPLLLGISKSSLNNPSFISASSFQETTRILTNAALEGKIDWLRGLKENIIIGHSIPSGTRTRNYQSCFRINKK